MKKLLISLAFIASSLFIFSDDKPYTTYTGEILQFNLNDGKDASDVLKMVKKDWYAL